MKDVLNFGYRLLEFFTHNGMTKIAISMLGFGVLLIGGGPSINTEYSDNNLSYGLQWTPQDAGNIVLGIGLVLTLTGFLMLLHQYKILSAKKVVLYYGNTLKFGGNDAPFYAVLRKDKLSLEPIPLDVSIDSYNKEEVIEDYKHNYKNFDNRTFHIGMPKIYMASLGSFPYLFLLGTFLRNGNIDSIVLDYDRDQGKWYRLDYGGEKATNIIVDSNGMSINDKLTKLCESDSMDIGIALGYTFEIDKSTIPDRLCDNTLYLKSSLGYGRDKLNRMETQISLLDEITLFIDRIKNVNKEVHLIVSAQASFCVNLGKRYQDNIMGSVHLHNFVQTEEGRERDWYITFNRGDVS